MTEDSIMWRLHGACVWWVLLPTIWDLNHECGENSSKWLCHGYSWIPLSKQLRDPKEGSQEGHIEAVLGLMNSTQKSFLSQ